jgi:thiamine-phosphate pyrophosphorylase
MPEQWLIAQKPIGGQQWKAIGRLPRGSGIVVLAMLDRRDWQRLRNLATLRHVAVTSEAAGFAVRVHNVHELTRALLRRTPLILVSPVYKTMSHPEWKPLSRMRAAALARLARRRALALGGMNARRYAKIAPLGFIGWAGISAFRT